MDIKYLLSTLKRTSTRVHKAYDNSCGKRGGRGSDFHMGYYAALDTVIKVIEEDNVITLQNAFWETRGYKVDKDGNKIEED